MTVEPQTPIGVPCEQYPNALAALQDLLVDGATVRAAVAFATDRGVGLLRELLAERNEISLETCAPQTRRRPRQSRPSPAWGRRCQ
jgi:hypothetical protein